MNAFRESQLASSYATAPLVGMILALVLAALPLSGHMAAWVLAGFFATCVLRLFLNRPGARLPSLPVKIILFAAGTAGVGLTYGTALGVDPGFSILVALISLKLIEANGPRDFHVLALLGFFLALCDLFFSQDLIRWLYVAAILLLLLATLVRFHRGAGAPSYLRSTGLAAALLLQALPIALLLFLFFPRVYGGFRFQFSQSLMNIGGMSETMTPGSIASMALNDTIVFRADFPDGNAPAMRALLAWRGHVGGRRDELEPGQIGRVPRSPGEVETTPWTHDPPAHQPPAPRATLAFRPRSPRDRSARGEIHARQRPAKPARRKQPHSLRSRLAARRSGDQRAGRTAPRRPAPADPPLARGQNARRRLENRPFHSAGNHRRRPALLPVRKIRIHAPARRLPERRRAGRISLRAAHRLLRALRRRLCHPHACRRPPGARRHRLPRRRIQFPGQIHHRPAGQFPCVVRGLDQGHRLDARRSHGHDCPGAHRFRARLLSRNPGLPGRCRGGQRFAAGAGWRQIQHELQLAWDSVNYQWDMRVLNYDEDAQHNFLFSLGLGWVSGAEILLWVAIATAVFLAGLGLWLHRPSRAVDKVCRGYERFCATLARAGLPREPWEGPHQYATRAAQQFPAQAPSITRITGLYIDLRYGPASASPRPFLEALRHLPRFTPASSTS